MKCKGCDYQQATEEGFCEYCIVYQKDPEKDNPLPHLFEYKGEKHYIFTKSKLEINKEYDIGDGFFVKRKKNDQVLIYKYKE